jgi:cytochrome c-type biogenesis protein CcmH
MPGVSCAERKRRPYFKRSLFQTLANVSKQRLMIWLVFALLTGAALLSVLTPLAQKSEKVEPASDVDFFKEQIAEIDREAAEGRIASTDAEIARTEAARRLLRAQSAGNVAARPSRKAALIAALATIFLAPALTLTLYSRLGHSNMPDMPLEARLATPPDRANIADAVARIEAHLAQNPDDGRGFEVVAPYYLRTGRFDDAVYAFGEALRLLGASSARLASLGEARMLAAGGVVTQEARKDFEAALAQDAAQPTSRFYLGLAAAQQGDREKAREIWSKLLAEAPEGAPWVEKVKVLLTKLDEIVAAAPSASDQGKAIAAMPEDQRLSAIRSMVDRLASRLRKNGDDVEGWLKLIRAYNVLAQPDEVRKALAAARKALAGKKGDLARVEALAQELKIGG